MPLNQSTSTSSQTASSDHHCHYHSQYQCKDFQMPRDQSTSTSGQTAEYQHSSNYLPVIGWALLVCKLQEYTPNEIEWRVTKTNRKRKADEAAKRVFDSGYDRGFSEAAQLYTTSSRLFKFLCVHYLLKNKFGRIDTIPGFAEVEEWCRSAGYDDDINYNELLQRSLAQTDDNTQFIDRLKLEHEGASLVAKAHRFHREVELKEGESRDGSATCTAC